MIICYDGEYNYMGAVFRITVRTSLNEVCEYLKGIINKGYEYALNELKKHGKCLVLSEYPLKIITEDNSIEVVLEPRNFIAQIFWGEAVKRVKSLCTQ